VSRKSCLDLHRLTHFNSSYPLLSPKDFLADQRTSLLLVNPSILGSGTTDDRGLVDALMYSDGVGHILAMIDDMMMVPYPVQ